jgi:hypothetical protein
MKRFLILIMFIILYNKAGLSQERIIFQSRSMFVVSQLDTARLLSDKPLKSPWGAVLRSAILPGWGQVYTHHYIKAVLALSVNSFFAYQIYNYEKKWQDEKNESFRNKRNLNSWYFALSYLLTMVDAYVEAYLYKFNTAMEISHRLELKENGFCGGELVVSLSF